MDGAGGLGRNTPLFLWKISQRDKAISSAILYTNSSKIHRKTIMFNPYAERIRFPSVRTDHFSLFRFIPHRQILAGYIPHPKTSHTDRYLSSCEAMTGADLWTHSEKYSQKISPNEGKPKADFAFKLSILTISIRSGSKLQISSYTLITLNPSRWYPCLGIHNVYT